MCSCETVTTLYLQFCCKLSATLYCRCWRCCCGHIRSWTSQITSVCARYVWYVPGTYGVCQVRMVCARYVWCVHCGCELLHMMLHLFVLLISPSPSLALSLPPCPSLPLPSSLSLPPCFSLPPSLSLLPLSSLPPTSLLPLSLPSSLLPSFLPLPCLSQSAISSWTMHVAQLRFWRS